jgi:hypothetical protein
MDAEPPPAGAAEDLPDGVFVAEPAGIHYAA